MPKNKNLAKRVRVLEQKQAADDKTVEYKVSYYTATQTLDNGWAANYDMAPRCLQGVGGESQMSTNDPIRIGNQVNLRHWVLEGIVELSKTSDSVAMADTSLPCRVIIADNLTDRTGLAATDVLQNVQSNSQSLVSPYKNSVSGGKRYKIYADYKFTLDTQSGAKRIKFRMPLPKSGRVCHFDKNNSANPSDFNLTLLSFANISPISSNRPVFTYTIKARFNDA